MLCHQPFVKPADVFFIGENIPWHSILLPAVGGVHFQVRSKNIVHICKYIMPGGSIAFLSPQLSRMYPDLIPSNKHQFQEVSVGFPIEI